VLEAWSLTLEAYASRPGGPRNILDDNTLMFAVTNILN